MRIERIWELEEKEFTDKLFRHANFKGGGGSGGGQNTQTVQKADPWSGQQEYLTDVFQKAQARQQEASPNFFPDNTIQGFDPLETNYQNQVTNYVQGNRPQQMQLGAENAINNELLNSPNNAMFQATRGLAPYAQQGLNNASGFTGQQVLDDTNASPIMKQMLSGSVQQNPFIQGAVNSFANDAVANFQNEVMPALRSSQIGAGQMGGGTRGEIAAGLAGGAGIIGKGIDGMLGTVKYPPLPGISPFINTSCSGVSTGASSTLLGCVISAISASCSGVTGLAFPAFNCSISAWVGRPRNLCAGPSVLVYTTSCPDANASCSSIGDIP